MTREETLKILAVLKAAYPSFYKGMPTQELEGIVALWTSMFADDDYRTVALSVKAYIATDVKGYPPHIGAIKDAVLKLTAPELMTELEAWEFVSRALRNSGYNAKKEFERLPELVQRLVGSPSQLREWALMETETVQSVVQSNFMRSYRARAAHEREFIALPSDVKVMLTELTAGMAFPQLEDAKEKLHSTA